MVVVSTAFNAISAAIIQEQPDRPVIGLRGKEVRGASHVLIVSHTIGNGPVLGREGEVQDPTCDIGKPEASQRRIWAGCDNPRSISRCVTEYARRHDQCIFTESERVSERSFSAEIVNAKVGRAAQLDTTSERAVGDIGTTDEISSKHMIENVIFGSVATGTGPKNHTWGSADDTERGGRSCRSEPKHRNRCYCKHIFH